MESLTTLLYHGTPPTDIRLFLVLGVLYTLARLWDRATDGLEDLRKRLAGPGPSAIE